MEEKKVMEPEVVVVSSVFKPKVEVGVKRVLMSWTLKELEVKKFADALKDGFHYIFKLNSIGNDGKEETMFHAEIRCGNVSERYAEAKLKQLELFPELSHTGGETIGALRRMLKTVVGDEEAAAFYQEYSDEIPVSVIDDNAAIWLRSLGIAPWYGGLSFPVELAYCEQLSDGNEDKKYRLDTTFSGFEFDVEDNFYNIFATRITLKELASALKNTAVLSVKTDKLMEDPAAGSVIRLTGFGGVIRPLNDD